MKYLVEVDMSIFNKNLIPSSRNNKKNVCKLIISYQAVEITIIVIRIMRLLRRRVFLGIIFNYYCVKIYI